MSEQKKKPISRDRLIDALIDLIVGIILILLDKLLG